MSAAVPLCYHAGLSKRGCEELLTTIGQDGAFLIRDSETVKGSLCLCVYKKPAVYTYRVVTSAGLYSLEAPEDMDLTYFKSLKELVFHYKKRNQGLAINLRTNVNRALPPPPNGPQAQAPHKAPHKAPHQAPHQAPHKAPRKAPHQAPHQEPPCDSSFATYVTVQPS